MNVEIKTIVGGAPRINITDVLKPADEDDEEDEMKPEIGLCCCLLFSLAEHGLSFVLNRYLFSV